MSPFRYAAVRLHQNEQRDNMLIAESPRWNARYDIGIVDDTPSTVTQPAVVGFCVESLVIYVNSALLQP